uniref:Uncharacterized protein n=1 Tax=Setaria digitata TaxID=48799 RepID=A0A915PIT3_9BILA
MSCYGKVVLLFGIVTGQVGELAVKDTRADVGDYADVINAAKELRELQYDIRKDFSPATLSKSHRKLKRPAESAWRCGDDQSYYFKPLNECYRINPAQFLNVDPDRKIAYGGTRNEYMFNCWQHYRGKLLDIGLKHIGEKITFVKQMVTHFNSRSFKRQAIQVGFMVNRNFELISQNGDHYDVLDKVYVEHLELDQGTLCPSVCCIVFLADTRAMDNVKMIYTSCDNRTRALSYICEAPALA